MTDNCAEVPGRKCLICIEIWQFELESCVWRVSFHKYAYVHGDPIQGIDPTGKWVSLPLFFTLAALSAALLTYAVIIPGVEASYDTSEKVTTIGFGGKDITSQMERLCRNFDIKWRQLPNPTKQDVMAVNSGPFDRRQFAVPGNPFALNIKGIGSWDASQLASPLMQKDFSSGPDWIPRSVSVSGNVHLAHEINYFFYGYLHGLASKQDGIGLSIQRVRHQIAVYRPFGYVLFNALERRQFDGSTAGRIAWATAGYASAQNEQFITPGADHSFVRGLTSDKQFNGSIQFVASGLNSVFDVDSR
jgi:hypothetical protein